jgi:hypothetical protein
MSDRIKTGTIQYHRNGVSGEPFYSVQFMWGKDALIATLTNTKGGCHVINPKESTLCYRGDECEPALRDAVIRWYCKKYELSLLAARDELNDGLKERVY